VTVTAAPASPKQRDVQYCDCRSEWPRGLRHELSSLAKTQESWLKCYFSLDDNIYRVLSFIRACMFVLFLSLLMLALQLVF
jgi:hypothetical protein